MIAWKKVGRKVERKGEKGGEKREGKEKKKERRERRFSERIILSKDLIYFLTSESKVNIYLFNKNCLSGLEHVQNLF